MDSTHVKKVDVGVQTILNLFLSPPLHADYPHLLRPLLCVGAFPLKKVVTSLSSQFLHHLLEDNLDVVEVGSSASRSCQPCRQFSNGRKIIPFPLIDWHDSRRR